jgi:hypothetical protein
MQSLASCLAKLGTVCTGSAIISFQGMRMATTGKWLATPDEEGAYAPLLKDVASAQAKPIFYAGKQFIVTRAIEETIFALFGSNEGLILKTAETVFVAAHYTEGQVGSEVSSQVVNTVDQLRTYGY